MLLFFALTYLVLGYLSGEVIAKYRSSEITQRFRIDAVQRRTSIVAHAEHSHFPEMGTKVLFLFASLEGEALNDIYKKSNYICKKHCIKKYRPRTYKMASCADEADQEVILALRWDPRVNLKKRTRINLYQSKFSKKVSFKIYLIKLLTPLIHYILISLSLSLIPSPQSDIHAHQRIYIDAEGETLKWNRWERLRNFNLKS